MVREGGGGCVRPGNDEAILRWNTCARTLDRMRRLELAEEQYEPELRRIGRASGR